MTQRPDRATLLAAWWAWRSLRATRRRLRRGPYDAVTVAAPSPRLPATAIRGVHAALRRTEPTCLERSLILQRWLASHGDPHDVIIGVTAPGADFVAHAWLEGETPTCGDYHELTRMRP